MPASASWRPLAPLVVALALACGGAPTDPGTPPPVPPPPPPPVPSPPPPPPTGHALIFEGVLSSVPELLTWDDATGAVARMLPEGMVVMDPQPSPDGSRIVFSVTDIGNGESDLFVINRDGSGRRQLTSDPEIDDQPSWSPTGDRIAFRSFRTGRDGDIWVMQADGSAPVNLTPDPLPGITDERHPAWSPDGTRIAFISNAGGNYDLWTMAADGSERRRLTATPDLEAEPSWSPDGRTIAFRRSAPATGSDIHLIPAGGGESVALVLPGEQRMPTWSPDGSRLVFVGQATVSSRPDLYEARTDGSAHRRLVGDAVPGGSLNPAFLRRR